MMNKYFVTVDANNNILHLFMNSPGYPAPPSDAKPITDADGEMLRFQTHFGDFELNASGAVVPLPSLFAHQQERTILGVYEFAAGKRAQAVGYASYVEMASWPIKRAQAIAYAASKNAADAPELSAEATARGITLDALVAKVSAKAAALLKAEAAIAGTAGKHADAIRALTTAQELTAYDYTTGWPV